ncbi:MAG: hypothetical protein A2W93_12470 [Bacteroidetes bacterium GWF2_43_63]|nr:MAG: hypothetical protein A2W94_06845 [Bacteroidetes bacterium GWE2_42_42]OFY56480.1 MAG: hypothetical protein A2W93_12470 [Bacteroidetes bacterium GWF2_43_63]HBG71174.1 hypothetical protein [Bacteroidales bacterium]HCB61257.1 hypothetical protein [Bacteroidales bacterium]HCY23274.1 hypothetical protein [Bacteroidales bacterium]
MLKKFRDNIFHKALSRRKAAVKRIVANKSFEESGTFLLLFDCTTEEKYNEFTRIQSMLQLQKKKVHAIGFHGMPATPAWCNKSLHVAFVGKNDMSKSGIPSDALVDEFLSIPVDTLIDLTYCMQPVFHWIIVLSAARLKIGACEKKNQQIFDLAIEVLPGHSQEEMFSLAIHFQNMFQKKQI